MEVIFQQGFSKTQSLMVPLEFWVPHSGTPQTPEQTLSSQALGAEGNKCLSSPFKATRAQKEGGDDWEKTDKIAEQGNDPNVISEYQQSAFTTKSALATEFLPSWQPESLTVQCVHTYCSCWWRPKKPPKGNLESSDSQSSASMSSLDWGDRARRPRHCQDRRVGQQGPHGRKGA